jgi:predicted nucleic-acid-binding protein
MTSVDTNVVVRLLTEDDPKQYAAAKSLFDGSVWIAKTVLLETAWVLRRSYGLTDSSILAAFGRLIALRNVSVEDEAAVYGALAFMAHGIAFADALHLASRPAGVMFVSFDRAFIRRAKRLGVNQVAELP